MKVNVSCRMANIYIYINWLALRFLMAFFNRAFSIERNRLCRIKRDFTTLR